MSRDYTVFLEDIEQSCEKVMGYTRGLTFEQFTGDYKTFDAVIRRLTIVGEAAAHVPQEVRETNPSVDWSRIVGMRNVMIHRYSEVDEEIVWDIAQRRSFGT